MEYYQLKANTISPTDAENANIYFCSKNDVEDNLAHFPKHFVNISHHFDKHVTSIDLYHNYYFGNLYFSPNFFSKEYDTTFMNVDNRLIFVCNDIHNVKKFVLLLNTELKKQIYVGDSTLYILVLLMNLFINDIKSEIIKYSQKVESLEDEIILDNDHKKYNLIILKNRRQVDFLKNRIEQINDFLDVIKFKNEDPRFDEYIKVISSKSDRAYDNAKSLVEQTIQLKEMYQNLLDIGLNNSMNMMTVVASIFLPLTMITGWYGMNVDLPEFSIKHSFIIPIVLSVLSVIFTLYLVKRFDFLKNRKK